MRYKLTLRWLGTHYCGWQVPAERPDHLRAPCRMPWNGSLASGAELTGCSRTDSGVHAVGFVAALKCESCRIPPEALQPAAECEPAEGDSGDRLLCGGGGLPPAV